MTAEVSYDPGRLTGQDRKWYPQYSDEKLSPEMTSRY